MWFAYIDESKEPGKFYVYTALVTTGDRWATTFKKVKEFREGLRRDHGIFISYELHAWKFVPGRGRPAKRAIYKDERAEIFRKTLQFIAECGCFVVVSSCSRTQQFALERLVTRIHNTANNRGENALLFFDEGDEIDITKRLRKMRVHNHIASKAEIRQATGRKSHNVPLTSILEDPIFKDSKSSYFIQLADFCAYALLRMEVPLASRSAYGIDKAYEILRPVTRSVTNPNDPRGMGIIRDKQK